MKCEKNNFEREKKLKFWKSYSVPTLNKDVDGVLHSRLYRAAGRGKTRKPESYISQVDSLTRVLVYFDEKWQS